MHNTFMKDLKDYLKLDLYLSKCAFFKAHIQYLGHLILGED